MSHGEYRPKADYVAPGDYNPTAGVTQDWRSSEYLALQNPHVARTLEEKALQGLFSLDARAYAVEDQTHAQAPDADDMVYIAGPMSGILQYNFPAFFEAEKFLIANGYKHVFNPARHGVQQGWNWQDYLAYDLAYVARAKSVCLLPGWRKSKGARLEAFVAATLGKRVFYYEDLQDVPYFEIHGAMLGDWPGLVETPKAEEPVEAEARRIVGDIDNPGPRQARYGRPLDNFESTARIWSGVLYSKLKEGDLVSPEDVALMMVGLKISREAHDPKRDNRVDGIGYWLTKDEIQKDRQRRAPVGEPVG